MEILSSFNQKTDKKITNKILGKPVGIEQTNRENLNILSNVSYNKPYTLSNSNINFGNVWSFQVPTYGYLRSYFVLKMNLTLLGSDTTTPFTSCETVPYECINSMEIRMGNSSKIYRYDTDGIKALMLHKMPVDMKNSLKGYTSYTGTTPDTGNKKTLNLYCLLPLPTFNGEYNINDDVINNLYPAAHLLQTEIKIQMASSKPGVGVNLSVDSINDLSATFYGFEKEMKNEKEFIMNLRTYECLSQNGLDNGLYKMSSDTHQVSLDTFKSSFPIDRIIVGVNNSANNETRTTQALTKYQYKNVNVELLDGNKEIYLKDSQALELFNLEYHNKFGLVSTSNNYEILSGKNYDIIEFSQNNYKTINSGYLNDSNSLNLKVSGGATHNTLNIVCIYQNVLRIEKQNNELVVRVLG